MSKIDFLQELHLLFLSSVVSAFVVMDNFHVTQSQIPLLEHSPESTEVKSVEETPIELKIPIISFEGNSNLHHSKDAEHSKNSEYITCPSRHSGKGNAVLRC
ncbi:MAG: hypothetical protein R3A80_13870 [Bdellovibrionota bacterium]